MSTVEVLQAENRDLRHQLRDARREATRLAGIIERKDDQIADLIATHHLEKMALIQNLDTRMTELLNMHGRLVGELRSIENRVTTSPQGEKVHGFAMTIRPLRENGAHEIRFIAGQENYVSRQVAHAPGTLFDFTETGNPIDLRQNFQREANARLRARIDAYLEANPEAQAPNIVFRCCRSRWEENEAFPLQEVAAIVTQLVDETNANLHLAALYNQLQSQMQTFIRTQRFRLGFA